MGTNSSIPYRSYVVAPTAVVEPVAPLAPSAPLREHVLSPAQADPIAENSSDAVPSATVAVSRAMAPPQVASGPMCAA